LASGINGWPQTKLVGDEQRSATAPTHSRPTTVEELLSRGQGGRLPTHGTGRAGAPSVELRLPVGRAARA